MTISKFSIDKTQKQNFLLLLRKFAELEKQVDTGRSSVNKQLIKMQKNKK